MLYARIVYLREEYRITPPFSSTGASVVTGSTESTELGNTSGTGLDDDNDDITDDGPTGVVDIANVLDQGATASSTGSATAN